ncbi:hypothetical protein BJ944DRAFT_157503 [Cunninghamella echinulata]|nr:hypothetical protein BJ944DRAFT_157503 [Cunninghamella echinulata]
MDSNNCKYYLGIDLSTQQLKCTVINESHAIVYENCVNFERDLPEFNTKNGAISHGNNVFTSPPLLWVKALDILLSRLKKTPYVSKIVAISGAAQQHGSVYWSQKGADKIKQLDASKTLHDQLEGAFSISQSPIWQDSSTTKQCEELEDFVGGPEKLAQLTGSKAYERFTGNQIAKIYQTQRNEYNATVWITLISSFIGTLLSGNIAPCDVSDASGTNLMDIHKHQWINKLLEHCGGPDLKKKLVLEPIEGGKLLGLIDHYYVQRYGFSQDCQLFPFTGDNPATLVSMDLQQGDCVVSLGTSDTVLVYLREAKPTIESHLLAHPIDPQGYMGMLCYKNGSLTREHFRDVYANSDWDTFNQLLNSTPTIPEYKGFYYWKQEIIPFAKGIYRFENKQLVDEFSTSATTLKNNTLSISGINIRCLIESQFISMKIRLDRMVGENTTYPLKRVLATGGASKNHAILQVLSNIFGLPVYIQKEGLNGASLGGALLAKYGSMANSTSFHDMMEAHQNETLQLVCEPELPLSSMYSNQIQDYIHLENQCIQ